MKKIILIALFVLVVAAGSVYALSLGEKDTNTNSETGALTKDIPSFSTAEVASHNSKNDCWTIIEGVIYEVTSYITTHPGGDKIIQACDKDATTLFKTRGGSGKSHSPSAESILARFKIGTLAD